MNKKLINFTAVVAKVFEILLWVGDAVMACAMIFAIVAKDSIMFILQSGMEDGTLTIGDFDVNVLSADGAVSTIALIIAFLAGMVSLALGAMICRNLNQIFKSDTPFCQDNVRLIREIGIFAIAIPLIDLVLGVAMGILSGTNSEATIDATKFFYGLVVLCLSQYFQYGAKLEKDMDGLV